MSKAGSSFKRTLQSFAPGRVLHAAQLAGDFVLPADVQKHQYIFVAGGIGITQFLSQLAYLKDTQQQIHATVFYCNNQLEDVAFAQQLHEYEALGVQTIHIITDAPADWDGEVGFLTKEIAQTYVPNISKRLVYLSGPPGMVVAYEQLFRSLGVPKQHIKTDYFSGLA